MATHLCRTVFLVGFAMARAASSPGTGKPMARTVAWCSDEADQAGPIELCGGPLRTLAVARRAVVQSGQETLYRALHRINLGEVTQARVAVFMVGLPGAGKSRIINLRYVTDHRKGLRKVESTLVLDLDKEIILHPAYDPANPDAVYLAAGQQAYKWADARVEAKYLAGLRDPNIKRLIIDGTGTNVERQIKRMGQARDAGFFVKALYVRVPARTAIVRAAMRKRGVSPERIRSYHSKIARAIEVARVHADEVEVVDVTFDDAPLPGTMHGYVDPITAIIF